MSSTRHEVYREIIERGLHEDYLRLASYMHFTQGMSYFNSALVILQRPGAACVKTAHAWMRDHGRTVKAGVTPIVIMKIGGPVSFVYDISDTEGERAPVRLKNIMEYHAFTTPLGKLYNDLQKVVKAAGIYYAEAPMGSVMFGESQFCPEGYTVEYNGRRRTAYYSVVINSTANDSQKSSAIIHELAHIFCGHHPSVSKEYSKKMAIPLRRTVPDLNTMEYEAEKTVEYVSKMMGIEYDADRYLNGYDISQVDRSLSEVYILYATQKLTALMTDTGIDPHLVTED